MYKIYINGTPLYLVQDEVVTGLPTFGPYVLEQRFGGKSKQLLQAIDMLEKTTRWEAVIYRTDDLKLMWKTFKSLFKVIKAAGGLIENPDQEVLWIYRRGSWDLPKGKIEKGEKKKEAAVREVQEETGIKEVAIVSKLPTTYHTYRLKSGKRILKKSYWYFMQAPKQSLVAQTEEDIELAEWRSSQTFKPTRAIAYGNIMDVFEGYLEMDN